MKYFILAVMLFISSISYAEPEWRQKPVQCGDSARAMQILANSNEKALVGGLTTIRMPSGKDELHPFYLFVNIDTRTFTILEYHLGTDEICIIGYGNSLDFDVAKLFEKKTES